MNEIWDFCEIDSEQQELLNIHQRFCKHSRVEWIPNDQTLFNNFTSNQFSTTAVGMDGLQNSLFETELSCRTFIDRLDSVLNVLDNIAISHADVTSRTNSLMLNCENLLEQQHSLQTTIESLLLALAPFNEVEKVTGLLGIPVDARGNPIVTTNSTIPNIDPRSQEFQDILSRLGKALSFLQSHPEFRDSDKYLLWLEQLQNRATSLIARSMRDLLKNASKSCLLKINHKSSSSKSQDEVPLESSLIYTKFRNLGFRMRDLVRLLSISYQEEESSVVTEFSGLRQLSMNPISENALYEVKQYYVQIRNELLLHVIRETTEKYATSSSSHDIHTVNDTNHSDIETSRTATAAASLCGRMRHSYSILLRLLQLEYKLFNSMFNLHNENSFSQKDSSDELASSSNNNDISQLPHPPRSPSSSLTLHINSIDSTEINSSSSCEEIEIIIEMICNATSDQLRPLIIRESDVDDLCRVITTLTEDIRTQILALKLPRSLIKCLLDALDRNVRDAQERLAYCAETKLRQEVHLFEPLPSQLAYPDILEKALVSNNSNNNNRSGKSRGIQQHPPLATSTPPPLSKSSSPRGTTNPLTLSIPSGITSTALEDVSRTWYPPLRSTLSLLSKMYGVVERFVFEDFARRSVTFCVDSLRSGAESVRKLRSQLHGDLFLVRHLLVLREQLIPFELNLQTVEWKLDFSSTGNALSHLVHNSRTMLRLDGGNAFLQMAIEGIPDLRETQVDAKKDLDVTLKTACSCLKVSAVRLLLGQMDAFLAKVTAFVGEIPITATDSSNSSRSSSSPRATPGNTRIASENSNHEDEEEEGVVVEGTGTGKKEIKKSPMLPFSDNLKGQSFMKAERVKELLQGVLQGVASSAPELRKTLQVYVENAVARAILLKPVHYEIDLARKKMEVVITNCVDNIPLRRDIEHLLQSISVTITSELLRS